LQSVHSKWNKIKVLRLTPLRPSNICGEHLNKIAIKINKLYTWFSSSDWVLFLAYPNLFRIKSIVVVVIVDTWFSRPSCLKFPSWWVSQTFYFWPGFCWILLRVVFLLRNRRPVFAWVRVRHPVILFDRFFTLKFEVGCGDSSCSRQQHVQG
jgi:hypothetical protein